MRRSIPARRTCASPSRPSSRLVLGMRRQRPPRGPSSGGRGRQPPRPVVLRDEIPPDQLDAVLKAHFQGLGHMERYEYAEAARAFRDVHARAPGWIAGSINLAIALLNQTGTVAEKDKDRRAGGRRAGALRPGPRAARRGPRARSQEPSCLLLPGDHPRIPGRDRPGASRLRQGHGARPDRCPRLVQVRQHPARPDDPGRPAGPKQAKRLVEIYTKALECNPYLVSTLYKLQTAYAWSGDRARQKELHRALGPALPQAEPRRAGRFGRVVLRRDGALRPGHQSLPRPQGRRRARRPPRFDPPAPLDVRLAEGSRWARIGRLHGAAGAPRPGPARFGAAVATFDADGDGKLDLYLTAAVVGPKGVRDAPLAQSRGREVRGGRARLRPPRRPGEPRRRRGRLRRRSQGRPVPDRRRREPPLPQPRQDVRRHHQGGGRRGRGGHQPLGALARPRPGRRPRPVRGQLHRPRPRRGGLRRPRAASGRANAAYRNDGKPAPIAGRPEDNWAPLAVAPDDLPATAGLSIAFTPWPDAEALSGGDRRTLGGGRARPRRRPRPRPRPLGRRPEAPGRPERPPRAVPRRRDGRPPHARAGLRRAGDGPRQGRPRRPRRRRPVGTASPPPGTRPSGPPPIDRSPGNPGRPTPRTGGERSPPTSTSTPGPTWSASPRRASPPRSRGPGTTAGA